MARELRRAKSMNVPVHALRQAGDEEQMAMLSPGGRMPLSPKQPQKRESTAPSLGRSGMPPQLQVPGNKTLSRSNSNHGKPGFGEKLRSGSNPSLFPSQSPRPDREGGKIWDASLLPPLGDRKGGRKPAERGERSEHKCRTWTPASEMEVEHQRSLSSTTGTPSPKSKASSSQMSDTGHWSPPPTGGGMTLEVPSHMYDEGGGAPSSASAMRHRSAATILERFTQGSARGAKERHLSGERFRQPPQERWQQEASPPTVANRRRDSTADRAAEAMGRNGREREAGSKRTSLASLDRRDSSCTAQGGSKRTSLVSLERRDSQERVREAAQKPLPTAAPAVVRETPPPLAPPPGSGDNSPASAAGCARGLGSEEQELEPGPSHPGSNAGSHAGSGRIPAASRRRSRLAVPGHLPLEQLQLMAAQEQAAADAPEGSGPDDPPQGLPARAFLRKSSTCSQLTMPARGDEALVPGNSGRNEGIWRMGLSGRRRRSPRPEEPAPQVPLRDIRVLRDEKIYDLYCWDEVLQEVGDGGKVVICRLKSSPEDTFGSVMKIRSKESLRRQSHEEEFRKAQIRMLNFPPHRGILCPRDIMEDDRFYYIVMDRAMGGSFFGSLVTEFEDGRMPQEAVRRVMREILEAVHHIHRHRMLHRDIKPDNLMMQLSEDTEGGEAKIRRVVLIDFDHADSDWSPGAHSTDHSCYGTLRFNAPETLHGEYSASSDLYSVGGVLYLLMTGKMPHSDSLFEEEADREDQGDDMARGRRAWMDELYTHLKEQPIDWTCDPWPENPQCRDFCATLLAFHPLDRFPSAEEALRSGWLAG